MRHEIRVAAVQFATNDNLESNLATCLRMLDEAVATEPDLIVFPEFANHISVYESAEHCRRVAVPLDGPWMTAIRDRVAHHGVHLVITVTVPREPDRVTVTNVLVGPTGEIIETADKQTLMGNEREFLDGGEGANDVAHTEFGPIGLYSCMDGVTFETPRGFAVRGARLLTNSLNSFALDEAALHIPVRAVENGVFVVAANKVGPLLPPDRVQAFSEALGVPPEALNGAGESQIVAPDGTIMAKAPLTGEAVIVAVIDLRDADSFIGRRDSRRPDLYADLAKPDNATQRDDIAESVSVRCIPGAPGDAELVAASAAGDHQLVVLPEGSPVPDVIAPGVHLVTTAFVDGGHQGQVWTEHGLVHTAWQIHRTDRLPGIVELGDVMPLLSTSWGDLALVIGDDHQYPESFRLAAIAGAHAVAVCYAPEHAWEVDLALRERAAENRLCVAACAPSSALAATIVLNPPLDSLWSPERRGPYDGTINTPEAVVALAGAPVLDATLHPKRSLNREISRNTDLVGGRSWQASSVLVE